MLLTATWNVVTSGLSDGGAMTTIGLSSSGMGVVPIVLSII